jgi:hypothetical protein
MMAPDTAGGDTLTIVGSAFGHDAAAVTVTIQFGDNLESPCVVSSFVVSAAMSGSSGGEQRVECVLPAGAGTARAIVTVAAVGVWQSAASAATFAYAAPSLTALSYNPAFLQADAFLTVTGENFGPEALLDLVSIVLRRDAGASGAAMPACIGTEWRAATQLVCVIEQNSANNLTVSVRIGSGGGGASVLESNALRGSFFDPPAQIFDVIGDDGEYVPGTRPTDGSSAAIMTIVGTNLGSGPGQATVRIGAAIAIAGAAVQWVSPSELRCRVPAGQGAALPIAVDLGGQRTASSLGFVYSFDEPELLAVAYNRSDAVTQGGAFLNLHGANFGVPDVASVAVLLDSVAIPACAHVSHTLIRCRVASGVGANLSIAVRSESRAAVISNGAAFVYSYLAPEVSQLLPRQIIVNAAGLQFLVIDGVNFGNQALEISVRVDGEPCLQLALLDAHTRLQCVPAVPLVPRTQRIVLVTVRDQESSSTAAVALLDFVVPHITSISSSSSSNPTSGGAFVDIHGVNFGNSFAVEALLDGVLPCRDTLLLSNTTVRCVTPVSAGANRSLSVRVGVASFSNTWQRAYSYDAPVVTFASFPNGTETGESVTLWIDGYNFGSQATSFIEVLVGDAFVCAGARLLTAAASRIQCTLPADASGADLSVEIRVDGQSSRLPTDAQVTGGNSNNTGDFIVTFAAPRIDSVSPSSYETLFDETLVIEGASFGRSAAALTVRLGATQCTDIVMLENHVRLSCAAPEFEETHAALALVVSLNGVDSNVFFIAVQHPEIGVFVKSLVYLVGVLGELLLVAQLLGIWRYRNERPIRSASVVFSAVLVLGAMLWVASVFARPLQDAPLCHVSYWLEAYGFSLVFGSLVLKNYRLLAIFSSMSLRVAVISLKTLFAWLVLLLLLDTAVLVPFALHSKCGFPRDDVVAQAMLGLLLVSKAAVLVAGAVVAFKSRIIDRKELRERTVG